MGVNMNERAVLHISDWNYEDKYYEAPIELIREFKARIEKDGLTTAWEWWVTKVDYVNNDLPVKFGLVDMRLDVYFMDYNNAQESISEWEL